MPLEVIINHGKHSGSANLTRDKLIRTVVVTGHLIEFKCCQFSLYNFCCHILWFLSGQTLKTHAICSTIGRNRSRGILIMELAINMRLGNKNCKIHQSLSHLRLMTTSSDTRCLIYMGNINHFIALNPSIVLDLLPTT